MTENLADFPAAALAPFEIEATSADDFLLSVFKRHPEEALAAIRAMRLRYRAPPYSGHELVSAMLRAGLVRTATKLKAHIASI